MEEMGGRLFKRQPLQPNGVPASPLGVLAGPADEARRGHGLLGSEEREVHRDALSSLPGFPEEDPGAAFAQVQEGAVFREGLVRGAVLGSAGMVNADRRAAFLH